MSELFERYPALLNCKADIEKGLNMFIETYRNGGKILIGGNGGSCADSEHIVGELMKGFMLKRPVNSEFEKKLEELGFEDAKYLCENLQGSLPAISLPSQTAILSAFINDVSPEMMYAQMVYGYATEKDLLVCLSTSGNSKNLVQAAKVAKAKGARVLSLTGEKESLLSKISDVTIRVPETETYKVQELHLPVYHHLCAMCESEFFEMQNTKHNHH